MNHRIAVVGAGMVGLSTAWFLQERGAEVTVVDKTGPAAGSSWGNAGWITPTLSTPLPEPSVLAYGIRNLVKPSSPVYVQPAADPGLAAFLARFARNSTAKRWRIAMEKLIRINRHALDAFDALTDAAPELAQHIHPAEPFIVGYADPSETETLLAEGRQISAAGQHVEIDRLPIGEARAMAPMLSPNVRAALSLRGQRYVDPGGFVAALADSVTARGGTVRGDATVTDVRDRGRSVALTGNGIEEEFDTVVLADGAALGALAKPFGVRAQVRPGRGYSFSVAVEHAPPGPLYFPTARVACTPIGDRMRVAGMMEFRPHDAPLDPRRIKAIVESVRPLLQGVDLDDRRDEWVGSRPCTADGLPLIGVTRSPRVYVAGGHGMWGMTLGPATGQLVAEAVDKASTPPDDIADFDPLR